MPKGVYDRATSKWKPPSVTYPPELIEQVRLTYEAGHTLAETAEICGVGVHVLQRLMSRHGITRRPAIKRDQRGPANSTWKGDAAGYSAMHLRVATVRGTPSRCSACDTEDPTTRYEWASLTGRYEDPTDYVRLCVSCHRLFDRRRPMGGGVDV